MKYSFDWSNAINPERRDLVFENRNKEYGGYALRRDYQRHVLLAFLITLFGIGVSVITPVIISFLSKSDIRKDVKVTEQLILENFHPYEKIIPPVNTVVQHPSVKQLTKFTQLKVVVDKLEHEPPPTQETINAGNPGINTQGNDLGDAPEDSVIETDEPPRLFVDEMPVFPGGEKKLFEYLANIIYPASARQNGIQGRVYITFVIDKNGKIKEVKKLRGIGGGCDEEAMRVVSMMPDWKPGRQDGRNVAVQFNLPVNFRLK